ncbi:MAG: ABC transporter ATP-binding protein, partial [Ancrocorticia sp.]|nr:ABC transporter ATP-binding protein [Ancrocorticia sp.]
MNQSTPNLHGLLTWLTGITHPVHKPLLVSTFFRFINLTLDIVLFGLAGGGVAAIITGTTAWPVFLWLVIVALVKASAYYLEQLTGHYVAFKALELLRTEVFSSLWPKAPAIVTHAKSGDILASLTRDVDRIEVVYAHTFAPVVSAFVVP